MKKIFMIIFLYLLEKFVSDCIPEKNCFKISGECVKNICQCKEEFWTLKSIQKNKEKIIYCNYKRTSRFTPLILEIFFPGIGHLVMKKYVLCIIKLFLLTTPIILILSGYYTFKSEKIVENNEKNTNTEEKSNLIDKNAKKKINEKEKVKEKDNYYSDEGNADSSNISDTLYTANHIYYQVPCIHHFLLLLESALLISFILMDIIDLIRYGFAFYTDANNVPLI